jgi:3-oxoacyl-ACP reductase-like protein
MRFVGSFFEFSKKVLAAAKKGGLTSRELKKLDNLLTRTGKRNTVLAKGILTALSAGGASNSDVTRFSELLLQAEERIITDKKPFNDAERKELTDIFKRAYVSAKTAQWFSAQVDELLAEEISEFVSGSRRIDLGVPTKKSVRFEAEAAPQERKKAKI